MNSDFEELLRILNGNEVKYLIVGGYVYQIGQHPGAQPARSSAGRTF
jgi:hypothetical protein